MISPDEYHILIEKKKSDIWLSMRKVDHNLSTTFGDKKNPQVFVTSILSNGFRQKKNFLTDLNISALIWDIDR